MAKKVKNKFVSQLNICPFCKTRKTGDERFCFACNLNFGELENTNVKDAVRHKKGKNILQSYEGEIVYSPLLPNDVSISSLKMFVVFLGFFGVHNFYAGRILRGIFTFIFGVLTIGAYVLYSHLLSRNIDITVVIVYFSFVSVGYYFYDIYGIFKRRYKFPVLLKTPVDIEKIYKAGTK